MNNTDIDASDEHTQALRAMVFKYANALTMGTIKKWDWNLEQPQEKTAVVCRFG